MLKFPWASVSYVTGLLQYVHKRQHEALDQGLLSRSAPRFPNRFPLLLL